MPALGLAMLILGLMFAHFTELQHELLHGHAFRSPRVNRVLGFFSGLFMLNSYSHYKYHHLHHHKHLGTERNNEFFEYPRMGLDSPLKLALAALNPSRFARVGQLMVRSILGEEIADVPDQKVQAEIRTEYRLYAVVLLGAIAYTIATGDPTLLLAWFIPAVLISEPAHYLIELPEHFGLDVYRELDTSKNTRSIDAGWLARWYTNGNNLHTAHHWMSGVPMGRCKELHDMQRHRMEVLEPSYFSFYRKVMSGELQPFTDASMTHSRAGGR